MIQIVENPKIFNKRICNHTNAVYIGRGSKWGNPFIIGKHGTRLEVIEKYKNWLFSQPQLLKSLHELKGKNLICWCSPLACHGDVLLTLSNGKNYDTDC